MSDGIQLPSADDEIRCPFAFPSSRLPRPNGSSYTTLVTHRLRMSKSESPLSSWKFAGFRFGDPKEPAESVSIDLAKVCAIRIWKPLLKRFSNFKFKP